MTIKKISREFGIILIQTFIITGITLFGVMPFSCKVTTEGIEIIGGDYEAPVIETITVVNERTVEMEFSQSINVTGAVVTKAISGISDSLTHSGTEKLSPSIGAASGEYGTISSSVTVSEDGKTVTFFLDNETEIGKTYEIYGSVNDKVGNSLTFCVPFVGYNCSIPKIIITELQIKYGKGSVSGETIYRGEYVEFLALEDGNLAGLELYSAADGDSKKYVFPAVEVTKGEIFLVHLRTVGEGCENEIGDDLNLATAPHSKDGIRDLWLLDSVAHFNDASDVVYVWNTVNGTIMDGLMYADPGAGEWKMGVGEAAEKLFEAGIYNSFDISAASSSKGCTTLKSLTRSDSEAIYEMLQTEDEYEYPFESNDELWIVTSVSPGVL